MRRNKYLAKRTQVDGIWFHSKGEANRWQQLTLLERAGEIRNLDRQVPYSLTVKGVEVGTYVADFTYDEATERSGKLWTSSHRVVEDFKGVRTSEYRLKAKLMKAIYGIEIRETRAT